MSVFGNLPLKMRYQHFISTEKTPFPNLLFDEKVDFVTEVLRRYPFVDYFSLPLRFLFRRDMGEVVCLPKKIFFSTLPYAIAAYFMQDIYTAVFVGSAVFAGMTKYLMTLNKKGASSNPYFPGESILNKNLSKGIKSENRERLFWMLIEPLLAVILGFVFLYLENYCAAATFGVSGSMLFFQELRNFFYNREIANSVYDVNADKRIMQELLKQENSRKQYDLKDNDISDVRIR